MSQEKSSKKIIRRHTDLEVYQKAFAAAMRIFEMTKTFPKEERCSLTDQIRRSSRSVCANLGEAWRKRRMELYKEYDAILGMLINMIIHLEEWAL